MSVILDTELGGQAANSYVTRTGALEIIALISGMTALGVNTAGFEAASNDQQSFALIMGAQRLDSLAHVGERMNDGQALQYPRIGTEVLAYEGVIPDPIKHAQVIEACAMFNATTADIDMLNRGVQSYTVGSKSVTFRADATASETVSQPTVQYLRSSRLLLSGAASLYLPRG